MTRRSGWRAAAAVGFGILLSGTRPAAAQLTGDLPVDDIDRRGGVVSVDALPVPRPY